jgi:hypothetical protein
MLCPAAAAPRQVCCQDTQTTPTARPGGKPSTRRADHCRAVWIGAPTATPPAPPLHRPASDADTTAAGATHRPTSPTLRPRTWPATQTPSCAPPQTGPQPPSPSHRRRSPSARPSYRCSATDNSDMSSGVSPINRSSRNPSPETPSSISRRPNGSHQPKAHIGDGAASGNRTPDPRITNAPDTGSPVRTPAICALLQRHLVSEDRPCTQASYEPRAVVHRANTAVSNLELCVHLVRSRQQRT